MQYTPPHIIYGGLNRARSMDDRGTANDRTCMKPSEKDELGFESLRVVT